MTEAVPHEVSDLLARQLPTMEHVEVLLSLASDETRAWSVGEVAARVHAPSASVADRLTELVAAGLASAAPSATAAAYQYAPQTPTLRRAVELLEEMYRTKPVTLIKAIYERPAPAVQSFADAFRLRKAES